MYLCQQNFYPMRKILLLSVALLLLFSSCQESLEKRAQRALQEYSDKNCPIFFGDYVVMDSCAFDIPTLTLNYYYHFRGAMDNDSALQREQMRQTLLDALKNETTTRVYKEASYNFRYTYFSEKEPSKKLFEALFTPEDYK